MPSIRPVSLPTDHAALDHIFRTTSGPSFKPEPAATISSHLFCHAYAALEPRTSLVLVDSSNTPVGYILGTPDTRAFASRWKREYAAGLELAGIARPPDYAAQGLPRPDDFESSLLDLLFNSPEELLNLHVPSREEPLAATWGAHFHVDILPAYQRQGWGAAMVEEMCGALRAGGARGVHLGLEGRNEGAARFYARMGFRRAEVVLDGGVSGEVGRMAGENGTVFMVKDLVEGV